jgi:hypothetical protein
LEKPDFLGDLIIYANATEEAISAILLPKYDINNEHPIAYMSQILSDDKLKYSLIENHTFSLVKAIEKFHDFVLGKHTEVKFPLHAVKFLLSQTHLSIKLAHCLSKIQEHDFTITTSNTINGHDLALHLGQHHEPGYTFENNNVYLSALSLIEYKNLDLAGYPWYPIII